MVKEREQEKGKKKNKRGREFREGKLKKRRGQIKKGKQIWEKKKKKGVN